MTMKRIPSMKSVMTPFPHSVELDAPVRLARNFMRKYQIRHLPVVDKKKLAGVVTDRDIKLILGPDFDCPPESELTVRDVYIADPYIVHLNEPLDHVLLTMAEEHIGSVLVTKNGKLAGLFTTTDACRYFGEFLREKFPPRGDDEAA